jgi:hypothetical protein
MVNGSNEIDLAREKCHPKTTFYDFDRISTAGGSDSVWGRADIERAENLARHR